MKSLKKLGCSFVCACCMMLFAIPVFAGGSYSSTYEMTGGVFSDWIDADSYITTHVDPWQGTSDANMGIILAQHHWYGWDGDEEFVSSTSPSTTTFDCSGRYKIWLRNYTGQTWSGSVDFSWE